MMGPMSTPSTTVARTFSTETEHVALTYWTAASFRLRTTRNSGGISADVWTDHGWTPVYSTGDTSEVAAHVADIAFRILAGITS